MPILAGASCVTLNNRSRRNSGYEFLSKQPRCGYLVAWLQVSAMRGTANNTSHITLPYTAIVQSASMVLTPLLTRESPTPDASEISSTVRLYRADPYYWRQRSRVPSSNPSLPTTAPDRCPPFDTGPLAGMVVIKANLTPSYAYTRRHAPGRPQCIP